MHSAWGRLPIVAVVAVLAIAMTSTARAQMTGDATKSPALCAPGDPNPEPGMQGDVPSGAVPDWDCGVRPIGFVPGAGGSMAVAANCAYTGVGALGGNDGVHVIDVRDPTKPRLVTTLPTGSRELLAAQITRERGLLATRRRDTTAQPGQVLGRDVLVDIWDIFQDCTKPKLLGTARMPTTSKVFGDPPIEVGGPMHNLKFNPTATKLYGSLPMQEIDLRNLKDPSTWTFRNLHCAITSQNYLPHMLVPGTCEQLTATESPMGAAGGLPAIDHEPTFNPDGSRLYIGGQLPLPNSNQLLVLDMTGPNPVILSQTEQAPGHSIDYMTIRGRRYVLHSNEITATGCLLPEALRPTVLGFADRAYVLDITDERKPVKLGEIRLAASRFDHCSTNNVGGPSTAYHEVDDPTNTTYAVIGFTSAGHRIFDMRDPAHPVEVAYFNRGASSHTKSYVISETGHIWASNNRGFWVLELEPQVRRYLGLAPAGAVTAAAPGQRVLASSQVGFARADAQSAEVRAGNLAATGAPSEAHIAAVLFALAVLCRRVRVKVSPSASTR